MKKSVLIMMSMLVIMTAFSQEGSYRLWKNSTNKATIEQMRIKTTDYLLKSLDLKSFKMLLPTVHKLPSDRSYSNTVVLGIPMPGDVMATFRVQMSDVMDPVLEAKYPDIRTFNGQGISDPRATITLDYNLNGVHAMVLTPFGDYFIDPAFTGNTTDYLVYYKKDLIKTYIFEEGAPIPTDQSEPAQVAGRAPSIPNAPQNVAAVNCTGKSLRKYRMAISCTGEYAVAATGVATPTIAQTLSCIQTTFARVVGVYEKELAITMVLTAKEDTIIFTNASTDPFTGNLSGPTLITESQTVINKYIGSANYDVGHTFSTGGGGLSDLGVICSSGTKASSITGSPTPTGDGYDIDYVAHEMGHAFGANHTFNDNANGSCQGNYNSTTNNEPGSGITIMAYAGICTGDDLAPHSLPIFTAMSFNEIEKYNTTGIGRTCAVNIATTNNPPVVALTPDYTIPYKTPFKLFGSATDPNGDSLTYCWEQVNVGGTACTWAAPRATNEGDAPIFRTFNPVTDSFRVFPKMRAVVLNKDTIGELKPTYARTLKFRLTARDNRSGGGGVCYNENNVIVAAVTDSFWVKYPTVNTVTWVTQHKDSVTWNVTGTNAAPINCSKVAIDLSIDGGYTYPYTLVDSTPNTGSCAIVVPSIVTTTARVRVRAVGNIFFAISKANFTIKAHGVPVVLNLFNGFANATSNQLYWNSVTETGTDYYELERSADGKNFTDLAKVKALGNSTTSKDYTYLDDNVGTQDWYYRLRMVDLNGAFNYSNIIEISRSSNKGQLNVYPNPATDKIVVAHNKTQNAQLNIYNVQGQLVFTEKLNPTAVATEINVNNFSNGFYSIVINDNNATYKTKFIKNK